MRFKDRFEAGQKLATLLVNYRHKSTAVLLAVPPGGVPVAFEIAKHLGLPIDISLVKNLTIPHCEDNTADVVGVIDAYGVATLNPNIESVLMASPKQINQAISKARSELSQDNAMYRGKKRPRPLQNKHLILVDDGLSTGDTMVSIITALKRFQPTYITVAVPIASSQALKRIEQIADEVVCAFKPKQFDDIRSWYIDFSLPQEQLLL